MKRLYIPGLAIALLLCLSGCAQVPAEPESRALPAPLSPAVLSMEVSEERQRADNLPVTFVFDGMEISIGMTQEQIEAQTGSVLGYDYTPVTREITFYKYDGIDVAYREGVAGAIRLQPGSEWHTNAGIGMGSRREEMLDAYGFDLLLAASNGVNTLTYRVGDEGAVAVTWKEYSEVDPYEAFYLSVNVSQSGVVYDLVLRNRAYVDNIFQSTQETRKEPISII